MILTLEPTGETDSVRGVRFRVWKGKDQDGIPVLAWVQAVSPQTDDPDVAARYEAELHALPGGRPFVMEAKYQQ